MKTAAICLSLVGAAVAFTPAPVQRVSSHIALSLDDIGGASAPLPNFDPLDLANFGSDETLRWFRAAELKHSRVAMIATTGYLVNAAGFHFPGMLSSSSDISFESLSTMAPPDAWAAVPDAGKAQILVTIFIAELATEGYQGKHYMKGGELPTMVFPAIDFSGVSEATMATKRTRELNNGRLAMIAILSFIAAHNIPGSVPALGGLSAF
jgi:hypothetical protein